jgi:hypothetical protein
MFAAPLLEVGSNAIEVTRPASSHLSIVFYPAWQNIFT